MNAAEKRGLWLGFAGVAIFALTLPMTRLAVGTADAPLMSGVFIALGRAAAAADAVHEAIEVCWVLKVEKLTEQP